MRILGQVLQHAIDLDPNYADAYAALGFAYYEAVISGWSQFRAEELERAEALAQRWDESLDGPRWTARDARDWWKQIRDRAARDGAAATGGRPEHPREEIART